MDLHGYIVGDDGLLLKLVLLEDVGLKDLLKLWKGFVSRVTATIARPEAPMAVVPRRDAWCLPETDAVHVLPLMVGTRNTEPTVEFDSRKL